MKSISGYSSESNFGTLLFQSYATSVNSVRIKLLSDLKNKSPAFHDGLVNILNRLSKKGSENNDPSLFEIFPWILRDITDLEHQKIHDISVDWVALYSYISLLDDYLDLNTEIQPNEILGASFLAHHSLINLFKIVNGTKYEKVFTDSLFSSAKYQLNDVVDQAKSYNYSFGKAESASGKNAILLACAGTVAASCQRNSEFIIEITQNLMLAVQLLDDLADFEEDYLRNNITIILNNLPNILASQNKPATRENILHQMICNNSLCTVISIIESSLTESLLVIRKNYNSKTNSTSAYIFMTSILNEVIILKHLLEENQGKFEFFTKSEQAVIIEEVDKRIRRIYLHT
jgi:hypothetical protein